MTKRGTTLVIAIDCTALEWSKVGFDGNQEKKGAFNVFVRNVVSFVNFHQISGWCSTIRLLAFDTSTNHHKYLLIWSKEPGKAPICKTKDSLAESVISFTKDNVSRLLQGQEPQQPFNLFTVLSMCLICISEKPEYGKVLILKVTPDIPSHHSFVISCGIVAKNTSCCVDTVSINHSSDQLSQVSQLTNGSVVTDFVMEDNLKLFLWLADNVHFKGQKLDMKYTKTFQDSSILVSSVKTFCICHKRPIEIGFVCTLCMSIYCQYVLSCEFCKKKFQLSNK